MKFPKSIFSSSSQKKSGCFIITLLTGLPHLRKTYVYCCLKALYADSMELATKSDFRRAYAPVVCLVAMP
jgi:hypothetical protein